MPAYLPAYAYIEKHCALPQRLVHSHVLGILDQTSAPGLRNIKLPVVTRHQKTLKFAEL